MPAGAIVGRVVRPDRGWVRVALLEPDRLPDAVDPSGVVAARTREDRIGTAVVGDWVVLDDEPDDLEVASVLERDNALRRADPVGEGEQVLAANIDQVLVVAGLDRPRKEGRLQRAIVQVHDAEATPVIVLTKADAVADAAADAAAVAAAHPDVDVVVTSSHTGIGLDRIRALLPGRTTVLLGESGAGKSSLLNVLGGSELTEVGDVRDRDRKGRHTTTRRELHQVDDGLVVDTPGVRAVGLYAEPWAVDATFPDVVAAMECRFGNCTHGHEPGCGVLAAVAAGTLTPSRLDAYRALHAEASDSQEPPDRWR